MPISGNLDLGHALGIPSYQGQFCMVGVDGNHYIAFRQGGIFPLPDPSVSIAQFENGITSSTLIDNTKFRADFNTLTGGTASWKVHTEIPAKGTPYLWILACIDGLADVAGIKYRIDGPDTFTPLNYLHLMALTGDSMPSDVRDLDCAAVLNGSLYACVCCGFILFVGDDLNTRLIGPLPLGNTNILDLTPGSWEAFSAALPFTEATLGAGIGGMDTLQTQKMSITLGASGIAVFWYKNNSSLPFTEVLPDTTNTGVVDKASAFGMPFADAGTNWTGGASGAATDTYLSPNVESNGTRIIFARGFTDTPTPGGQGYREMRLKEFTWDSTSNTPTFENETDFQYRVPADFIQTPRWGYTFKENNIINVSMVYIGDIFKSGFLALSNNKAKVRWF